MRKVTLRSLWEHKRRLLSTVLAIVLGVGFMAGTFILSTTLDQAYDDLFGNAIDGVDAVVEGPLLYQDALLIDHYDTIPSEVLDQVQAIGDVAEAVPHVSTAGTGAANRVLAADGTALGGPGGPPTTFENWVDSKTLSPYVLDRGRGPRSDDEVALNVAAADKGDLHVGDTVTAVSQFGPKDYTLVGTFTFGTARSAGGAVSAQFTLPEVQRLAGTDGRIGAVYVDGAPGITPERLAAELTTILTSSRDARASAPVQVVTGDQAVQQLSKGRQSGFGFLNVALRIFGAVALLVGIFVISNTFSILVAQRTRELALLRALGASREQVLGSVLLEATVVGLVSAVLGLGVGFLLAKAIAGTLGSFGAQLPTTSLVVRPATIVLSLCIGLLITLVAALVPAIRATRVPPLAALRDVAIDRSNVSRFRIGAGVVALAIGAWCLSDAWRAGGSSVAIPVVGIGSGLLIVGALVVGPVLAGRSVRYIGAPLPRVTGVTGKLATENAARSPKRTSATASAVVIGVALVTFVTVFAASANRSVDDEVDRIFGGDFMVKIDAPVGTPTGMPSTVADQIRAVPGTDLVAAISVGTGLFTYPDGATASHFLNAFDPDGIGTLLNARLTEGDLLSLTDDGIFVDKYVAKDHDIHLGDHIAVKTVGGELDQVVQGISDDRNVLGLFSVTRSSYRRAVPEALDFQVGGTVQPGADVDTVLADIEDAVSGVPDAIVLDRDGYVGDLKAQVLSFITVIYGLLMLSVVIALIGIANTLSLSITERTRELGLLRALGMDRIDLRTSIRLEALLISALGTGVGIGVGLVLSVALNKALVSIGLTSFAVPTIGLTLIILAAAGLGTLASIRPARRASGMSILDAIAAE